MRIPRLRLDSTGVIVVAGLIGALLTVAAVRAFVPNVHYRRIEQVTTTASSARIEGVVDGESALVIWVGERDVGWSFDSHGPGELEAIIDVAGSDPQTLKPQVSCRRWGGRSSSSSSLQTDGTLVMRPQADVRRNEDGFVFGDYHYPDGRVAPVGCSLSTDREVTPPESAD